MSTRLILPACASAPAIEMLVMVLPVPD